MKRWMSALLAALLLALCVGCGNQEEPSGIYYDITGIAPTETVMTVDGNEIPAQAYFYWTAYNCSYFEYQLGMLAAYGMSGDLVNVEDGSVNWDAPFSEDQTLSQYVKEKTKSAVTFYAVAENLAAELGVTLTEEDETAIADNRASMVEELGGEDAYAQYLEELGVDEETFTRLQSASLLIGDMTDLTLQEGSELYLPEEGYDQYATYADHILLATQDTATGAALSEEEIAEKRQTAEDLLSQLQASDDVVTLFGQLADEYSEDPGRAENPDGYIYTPGTMVAVFEDAAAALEPGQVSGIVESDYGYHIILRRDLSEGLANDPDTKRALAQQHLQGLLEERMAEAEVTVSEKLNTLDPGAFYTQYVAELEAMRAPADEAAGEDGADAAAGDASGDTAGETETSDETETSGNTESSGEADAGSGNGGESSGQ